MHLYSDDNADWFPAHRCQNEADNPVDTLTVWWERWTAVAEHSGDTALGGVIVLPKAAWRFASRRTPKKLQLRWPEV